MSQCVSYVCPLTFSSSSLIHSICPSCKRSINTFSASSPAVSERELKCQQQLGISGKSTAPPHPSVCLCGVELGDGAAWLSFCQMTWREVCWVNRPVQTYRVSCSHAAATAGPKGSERVPACSAPQRTPVCSLLAANTTERQKHQHDKHFQFERLELRLDLFKLILMRVTSITHSTNLLYGNEREAQYGFHLIPINQ